MSRSEGAHRAPVPRPRELEAVGAVAGGLRHHPPFVLAVRVNPLDGDARERRPSRPGHPSGHHRIPLGPPLHDDGQIDAVEVGLDPVGFGPDLAIAFLPGIHLLLALAADAREDRLPFAVGEARITLAYVVTVGLRRSHLHSLERLLIAVQHRHQQFHRGLEAEVLEELPPLFQSRPGVVLRVPLRRRHQIVRARGEPDEPVGAVLAGDGPRVRAAGAHHGAGDRLAALRIGHQPRDGCAAFGSGGRLGDGLGWPRRFHRRGRRRSHRGGGADGGGDRCGGGLRP